MLKNRSPTHLPSKEELLGNVTDKAVVLTKMLKFKKINGRPGTYGAYTCKKCWGRIVWTLAKPNQFISG